MTDDATPTLDQLRSGTADALKNLSGVNAGDYLQKAKPLVEQLRNLREYELMGQLAEAISRHDPKDATNRRLYAQYLIDTGKVTAAMDLLRPLTRLAKTHPEYLEATGLLGRSYKQIYFDARDKTTAVTRDALKQAIAAYRGGFEATGSTWHGVNLLALLNRARLSGVRIAQAPKPTAVAAHLIETLQTTPAEKRDGWFLATLAEASLGLGNWKAVERHLNEYVVSPMVQAFHLASTLRQFTQIWNLDQESEQGRALVNMLRARLAAVPGGELQLSPAELQRVRREPEPPEGQLEAVLGVDGPMTYRWWKAGVDRAVSVGAVCSQLGGRIGTGFVVRAGDLGREPASELLVLTNFHVVNPRGASPGIRPEEAEVTFEAAEGKPTYQVAGILWCSPVEKHDATLMRVSPTINGIAPLTLAPALPVLSEKARVYIIGHPGGRDLAFSFQDNELLDHEGPPGGVPQIPGVWRVHYRAPTEGGSSGSPVFNSRLWQVIALHHMGGKAGMSLLNGKAGTYAANEGISIRSIIEAMREAAAGTEPVV